LIFQLHHKENHRMVGFGRDLWKSSSPTPMLKQVHLEQTAQDCIQVGLEYLQRRRLHSLSGQPVPVLRHPHSKEVFFLMFRWVIQRSYIELHQQRDLHHLRDLMHCKWTPGIPDCTI